MDDEPPEIVVENQRKRRTRSVIEITGGGPGAWTYDVFDADRWSHLDDDERRLEIRRAIKRGQRRRREQRIRNNGPRDVYTREEIGERDGWRCAVCRTPVRRDFKAPHPCSPTVHHVVEICAGGTDTLGNVAIAHYFCNSDSYTAGQHEAEVARARLADRVLYGKYGPGRRDRIPDQAALTLAAEIMGAS